MTHEKTVLFVKVGAQVFRQIILGEGKQLALEAGHISHISRSARAAVWLMSQMSLDEVPVACISFLKNCVLFRIR